MPPTPEYDGPDGYEEYGIALMRDLIRRLVQPMAVQRDALADECVRLRAESKILVGRLMYYESTDSAHDPDHGIVKPPQTPVIEEDH